MIKFFIGDQVVGMQKLAHHQSIAQIFVGVVFNVLSCLYDFN